MHAARNGMTTIEKELKIEAKRMLTADALGIEHRLDLTAIAVPEAPIVDSE
jgi:hypothetical protein